VLEKSMQSAALGRSLPYRIYLPAGYEAPDALAAADGGAPLKRYPVLYLLHGLGSGARQWARLGLEAELDRQGAQVIVVTPAGKAGYWVNHADGGPRWGDYVTQDLVAHIDATYRTVPTREGRGIGGISMGGHGALQLALNSPDLFGAVGAHSPAFRTRDQAPAFLGGTTLTLSSAHAPSPDAYAKRDPITLVSRSQATPPALWVDIGESDRWAPRARELETALRDRKWALQWSPRPGDHTNEYWAGRIPDYVSWYRARLEPAAR
jgi:putative tributyrin esterase